MKYIPIALPSTRKLAIEALRSSAQENPFCKHGSYANGATLSIREWSDYSYCLISQIENIRV